MDEKTELFNAIARSDEAGVRRLIADDAGLARAVNQENLPVLRFAKFMGDESILEALIDAGPPLTFFEAAMIDRTDRMRELLESHPDAVNRFSADGFTALHFAAYYGALGAMRLLIERGADLEAVTQNFLSNMPLHAAAAGATRREACSILLGAGANVNAKQHDGYAVLHTPAMHGDRAQVELMLSYGADPGVKSDKGETPGDMAAAQGHSDIAAMLRGLASPPAGGPARQAERPSC
jgi:ankyrin repeat protein